MHFYKSKGPMRKLFSHLIVLAALSLILSACGKSEKDSNEKPKQETIIPVEVSTLEVAGFADRLTLQGRLRALREVGLTAEIPGRIEGLPFDAGQRVGKGQTVVRLNARMAKAQLAQAEASVKLAKSSHERNLRLLEKKLIPPQQVEMSEAQLDQATAARDIVAINIGKAVIRSPIEGVVASSNVNLGEVANPGQPLLHIVDITKLYVDVHLPERDIALLSEGRLVDVSLPALGHKSLEGKVHRIGVSAHGKTRTFPVEVLLDNSKGELRPGMLASVSLVRRSYENAIVIPRDAVIDGVKSKSVYVLSGDKVHTRPVELGPVHDRFALVKKGLSEGEKLVVLGHQQVVEGQKVKVTSLTPCCRAELQKHNSPSEQEKTNEGVHIEGAGDEENLKAQP
ncbi:MAG: efflux RND transporter periplasmic adaptor subunit [Deltaproteobacteria bacterium]|nr:efflux RND transporter periplasmic adaptor subunit [Deltaproteobacteria bacterium]